jgi:hypothetical protein
MARKKQGEDDSSQFILVYAPFIVTLLAFSLYHYGKLKKQYIVNSQVKRVIDPGKFMESVAVSALAVAVIAVPLIWAYQHAPILTLPLGLAFLWCANWIGKMQARVFLGVVVDPERRVVAFEPDTTSFEIVDYLKITPYLRSLTAMEQVRLDDIEKITRQAGKHLYMHGDFGSRRISFSNKQKRDECIHFLTSTQGSRAKVVTELE